MKYVPRKTIHLTTFGVLAIGEGADASRKSRRALALLALAAAGGPNGADRDGIIALLWPDRDADRAANSFRQILHGIRRDLGDGAIVYEGGCIKLNQSIFTVDLWDFERAVRTDEADAVVDLYRGPFLGSFNITGLLEFERWAEGQRERLRQVALTTFRRLAARASNQGDHQNAVRRWREVNDLDPLSSKNAIGLLRALADSGDRTGALEFARAYETLVRAELETEPDEHVTDLVALLRRGSGNVALRPATSAHADAASPTPVRPRILPDGATSLLRVVSESTRLSDATSSDVESLYEAHHTHEEPTSSHWGRVNWSVVASATRARLTSALAAGVFLFVAAAATAASRLSGAATNAAAVAANVVAVLPFHAYDPADSSLSTSLAATLAADLDGAGRLHSVPTASVVAALNGLPGITAPVSLAAAQSAAKKIGAGLIVTGEIVRRGNKVRLSLSLHDAHGDLIGDQVIVDSDSNRVLQAIDNVTGQLVAQRYRLANEHLTRAALQSTRSVEAVKSFLRGESALRDGRYVDAIDEFARATSADATFALAYYRLAVAADWSGRSGLSRHGTELAIRYSDQLDDRDRRLVAGYAAFGDGHGDVAAHTYRSIIDDYPDDTEAWFQLGEALFHTNPLRGESATAARPAFERLIALDPDNLEAIIHLARIAALQQRQPDADAMERRALELAGAPHALDQRAFRAFALADRPGVRRVSRDLERAAPARFGAATLLGVAIDADDVFGTEQFARALVDESVSPTSRAFGLRLLAYTSLAQGRWEDTRAQLDTAMTLDRDLAIGQLSLIATMPFVPLNRLELQRIRDMVRDWQPLSDSTSSDESTRGDMCELLRLHRLGVLSVRIGDMESARRAIADLDTYLSPPHTRRYASTLAQSIRAHVSAEQGHLTEALTALDAADWEGPATLFAAEANDRFFRASLFESLGRTSEAVKWYSSIAERSAYELPYLAPAHLRLAGIAKAYGDTRAARAHTDRVNQLWRRADVAVREAAR